MCDMSTRRAVNVLNLIGWILKKYYMLHILVRVFRCSSPICPGAGLTNNWRRQIERCSAFLPRPMCACVSLLDLLLYVLFKQEKNLNLAKFKLCRNVFFFISSFKTIEQKWNKTKNREKANMKEWIERKMGRIE